MQISSYKLHLNCFMQSNSLFNPALVLLFFLIAIAFSSGVLADSTASENASESTGIYQVDSDAEKARKRQLMEKAIHEEKIKRDTKSIDDNNARRAAGEILGMDIFLAAFLSAFWMLVSFFIASRFFSAEPDSSGARHSTGFKVFHGVAVLIPILFLWVAVTNGFASWWLAFSIALVIYLVSGWVLKRVKNAQIPA